MHTRLQTLLTLQTESNHSSLSVIFEHKSELDSVQTARIGDLTEQDARHERELSAVERRFQERISELEVIGRLESLERNPIQIYLESL